MRGCWHIVSALALAGVTACQPIAFAPTADLAIAPTPQASAASQEIRAYYQRVESDLTVRGLLRIDGGGPDTPYTSAMLARNFERVTFFDEHTLGARLESGGGQQRLLSRWDQPVRIAMEFGPSVSPDVAGSDRDLVAAFATRLARVTDHPITASRFRANFHVMVMGEDDRSAMRARFAELLPGISATNLARLMVMPKDMHCLVIVSHAEAPNPRILSAVAIVRAEHPDLLRRACYHEEIAQGLGLVNDSPYARPSIFNDDDEFALLTSHDEALLSMLYDPRLRIGMSADEARPLVIQIAREKTGEDAAT